MRPAFNVRVYGLWLDSSDRILVTDEFRMGMEMTKFPGGGVESGEGLSDALKREFKEELLVEIDDYKLFYINDFYQPSAFNPKDHLLSVYYQIHCQGSHKIPTVTIPYDFPSQHDGAQVFRWVPLSTLHEDDFTFPVDKIVAKMLRNGDWTR